MLVSNMQAHWITWHVSLIMVTDCATALTKNPNYVKKRNKLGTFLWKRFSQQVHFVVELWHTVWISFIKLCAKCFSFFNIKKKHMQSSCSLFLRFIFNILVKISSQLDSKWWSFRAFWQILAKIDLWGSRRG